LCFDVILVTIPTFNTIQKYIFGNFGRGPNYKT
jgi:hypothetical protein